MSSPISASLRFVHRSSAHVLAAWEATQVELHGQFSANRLRNLDDYIAKTGAWRVLTTFFVSPLPCLALMLLIDAIPLAPPESGAAANYAFWLRSWAVVSFIDYSVILIIGQSLPQLGMRLWHAIVIGILAGFCSMAVVIPLVLATVFPFPFGALVASPPSDIVIVAGFAYFWGARLRADVSLRRDVMRQLSIFVCQVSLTFVYPMYISAFRTLDGNAQTFFVMLLPVIKMIGKNWVSYALGSRYDAKPEAVIFNVEVFHALFVSTAMQSSTSMGTTAVLVLVDLVQCWISVRDVVVALRDVRQLVRKIPEDHPFASKGLLQLALELQAGDERRSCCGEPRPTPDVNTNLRSMAIVTPIRDNAEVASNKEIKRISLQRVDKIDSATSECAAKRPRGKVVAISHFTSVHPAPSSSRSPKFSTKDNHIPDLAGQGGGSPWAEPDVLFSRDERETFVRQTASAFFIAEFVVLVEYTEVVVPFIYSIYLVAIFQMPNCKYYPPLEALDSTQRAATVTNVLTYAGLELLSLVLTSAVLKRVLGMSSAHQLAFVLDTQKTLVQSKLTMWVVYVLQFSLAHLGADFTFQFAWLH